MTESAFPFEGQSVSEQDFDGWARQLTGHVSGIGSGLTMTVGQDTRSITIQPGWALVDGTCYRLDAALTLAGDANTGGDDVYDFVVLTRTASGSNPRITASLVRQSATTPSWTQDEGGAWQQPLGYVPLAAGSAVYSAATVTEVSPRLTGGIATGATGNVPAASVPPATMLWDPVASRLALSDGAAWLGIPTGATGDTPWNEHSDWGQQTIARGTAGRQVCSITLQAGARGAVLAMCVIGVSSRNNAAVTFASNNVRHRWHSHGSAASTQVAWMDLIHADAPYAPVTCTILASVDGAGSDVTLGESHVMGVGL